MKKNAKKAICCIAFIGCYAVCFWLMSVVDNGKYETGVVYAKKNSTIYISSLNDALLNREIRFTGESLKYKRSYEITNVGDTVKFFNPRHEIDVVAHIGYRGATINGKSITKARKEFDNIKQLQHTNRKSYQK